MRTEIEKRQEVTQLLVALREAKGTQEKVRVASDLLATLDLIPDTPHSKLKWQTDSRLP